MSNYPSIYPAVVKSYDPDTRTCRVDIPQITSGGDVYPVAEVAYPIGDKPKGVHATEIEILPNDMVWVEFINNDPRHPVITAWRNPKTGNVNGWRKWHHANIGLTGDSVITITAPTINLVGAVSVNGSALTHNGVNVGFNHLHSNVQPGSGNSGPPVGGGGGGGGGSGIATGDGAAAGTYLSGIA